MSESGSDASDGSSQSPAPQPRTSHQAPWFRFALVFGVLAIGSEVLYYAVTLESAGFERYLSGIANISAWLLNLSGSDVVVDKIRISNNAFAVRIAQGCDAIQVCTLLASAIIAFPLPLRSKLRGLVIGIGILQLLNLARVVTLFWIGEHFKSVFKASHEILWPGFLIVATIVIWIVWVRLETAAEKSPRDAA